MRPATSVLLCLASLLACSEPDTRIEPAQVNWMEWPAEVIAATSFTVRVVGHGVYCVEVVRFVTAPAVDNSAVTFEPYFLLRGEPFNCRTLDAGAASGFAPIVAPVFDTLTPVPGLEAQVPRTYEIRAGTDVYVRGVLDARLPVRTFGEVTVNTRFGAAARVNAGGLASAARDSLGCVTLHPYGVYPGYVIENPPADTAQYWFGFVRGYVYEPAAPVCGENTVFHLVSRN